MLNKQILLNGCRIEADTPVRAAPSGTPMRGRVGWAAGLACAGVAADSRNAAAGEYNDGSPRIIKKFTWRVAAAFFLPGLLIFLK